MPTGTNVVESLALELVYQDGISCGLTMNQGIHLKQADRLSKI
jgi:hypothetical protein